MEIRAETVRRQRQQRGWTQQHLADAADCSLRTVQRIEKQGVASNESVSALCAVFELERSALLVDDPASPEDPQARRVEWLVAAAAGLGAGAGALMTWLLMSASGGV